MTPPTSNPATTGPDPAERRAGTVPPRLGNEGSGHTGRGPLLGLIVLTAVLLASAAAAHVFDVRLVTALDARGANLDGQDWYRALRVLGFLGTWLAVGAAMVLIDSGRRTPDGSPAMWSRGPFVAGAALLGGVVAEGLKIVLRRGRPDAHPEHLHVFWPWSGEGWTPERWGWSAQQPPPYPLDHFPTIFSASDFGLPSSHAATAFGGLVALAWLYPRAGVLFIALGLGCGLTRMLSRAHYLSDTLAGAATGAAVVLALAVVCGGRHDGQRGVRRGVRA